MADDYGHQLFPLIIINSCGPRNASNIDNTHSARSRACVAEACHACQEGDVRAKAGPWPEVVAIGNRLDWDLKGKWWEGILWFVSFVFQCFFCHLFQNFPPKAFPSKECQHPFRHFGHPHAKYGCWNKNSSLTYSKAPTRILSGI